MKKRTVLILGAGASMPFGFPSGEALVEQILDIPNNTVKKAAINIGAVHT